MTQCRLGLFASCLILLACFGCRQAELRPSAAPWEDEYELATPKTPETAPVSKLVGPRPTDTPLSGSTASVQPASASFYEKFEDIAPPRPEFELPDAPPGDIKFELVDEPSPLVTDDLPCDFLATLSPGARRFFGDGSEEYGEPARWEIVRYRVGQDLRCGWRRVKQDYRNYYSWDGLGFLTVGFGLGAIVANTNIDRDFQDWVQSDLRNDTTDGVAHWGKFFGEGPIMIACAITGWTAGEIFYDRPVGSVLGEWGGRTMRSALVGTPPMLILQAATGSSRPNEMHTNSRWRPFYDNNGVSGHTFMGALPFINAAKMSENIPLKVGFYACSLAPGFSRLNDDAHYSSQVLLGWWMAYWAATAVDLTNRNERSQWSVTSMAMGDGTGLGLIYSY